MAVLAVNFVFLMIVTTAVFALVLRRSPSDKSLSRRITMIHVAESEAPDVLNLEKTVKQDRAARLSRYLQRFSFTSRIDRLILQAASPMTASVLVLTSVGSGLAACLCVLLLVPEPLVGVGAFLLGGAVPYTLLKFKLAARIKSFNKELPNALDLMSRALRAGHSISSAIELIGEQSPEPLGPEFTNVFQQQKFGVRFREALLEMGDRVPSHDLHFLITAILVQRETGGDITEILDRTTYVIRERARIEGEVKSRTAQGKLTGWILGSLPVVMLVLINIISPGYTRVLFHDPVGQKMLYAGAAMIVAGGVTIRKIVNVKV